MTPIRISGKNLGQLALDDFCPRCFWLKMQCHDKLPYQKFPGIFASIDSFTKKVTGAHFAKYGRVPDWFPELGAFKELVPVPHHSKFRFHDETTEVLLTGAPDEVVRCADGSLVILDYKTSKFTSMQDSLLPLYRVQLNAYAVIAERIGLGKVTGLALIYHEPTTTVGSDDIDTVAHNDGFNMRFVAKILPVALALGSIPPLLARVREVFDLQVAPNGTSGCKDCRLLDGLVEMLTCHLPVQERAKRAVRLGCGT